MPPVMVRLRRVRRAGPSTLASSDPASSAARPASPEGSARPARRAVLARAGAARAAATIAALLHAAHTTGRSLVQPLAATSLALAALSGAWLGVAAGAVEAGSMPVSSCPAVVTAFGVAEGNVVTITGLSNPLGGGPRAFGSTAIARTPFQIVAMTALDARTVLVTDQGGTLYRISVSGSAGTGWSTGLAVLGHGFAYDKLAYDGAGRLFGTANGALYESILTSRYTIWSTTQIASTGWSLQTLYGLASGWLGATTAGGALLEYRILAPGQWLRYQLRASTWTFSGLASPGGGVLYGRSAGGALYHYEDSYMGTGSGAYLGSASVIDGRGWSQRLISSAPNACRQVLFNPGSIAQVQAEGRAMMYAAGWPSATQWSCLLNLWNRESGWRWWARNRSSGAYGIPQALPGSKMASAGADWQTNPATQIRWGLGYIRGAYGSPCTAWAHEVKYGWY